MNQQLIRSSAAIQTIAIACILGVAGTAFAQQDSESLAKAAQNPLASMISLPFQNNTNFDYGPEDGTQNVLNIQPVWPFKLNDDWNFVTRTILPVMSVPALTPGDSRTTVIGDTTFTGWFSPSAASKWIWGVGPVLVLPNQHRRRAWHRRVGCRSLCSNPDDARQMGVGFANQQCLGC